MRGRRTSSVSKESVLERVDADLERGDYGRARDRLTALIGLYPDDVFLRSRLAEVWWDLHFPAMAGRYWYLEENRTEEVVEAVEAFERSCRGSPAAIWRCLKFKGDPATLPPFARQRIEDLVEACRKTYGDYPQLKDGRTVWESSPKQKLANIGCGIGCVLAIALTIFLSVVGIKSLIEQWTG